MSLGMKAGCLGLLAALTLAGCASDAERAGGWQGAGALAKGVVAARKAPAPTGMPQLTRAQLASLPIEALLVEVENDKRGTGMFLVNGNSGVRTWGSTDGYTVSLREGVLISTRGFAPDLMSAAAPSARQIAAGQGSHRRSWQVLEGDDTSRSIVMDCQLSVAGSETLILAETAFPTRKIVEICTDGRQRVENIFWVGNGGKIRQSRQWTGTVTGALRIADPNL